MAEIYEGETPEGFTNTVNRDVNGDGTGIWKYTVRDDSTTSSTYDVVFLSKKSASNSRTSSRSNQFGRGSADKSIEIRPEISLHRKYRLIASSTSPS